MRNGIDWMLRWLLLNNIIFLLQRIMSVRILMPQCSPFYPNMHFIN